MTNEGCHKAALKLWASKTISDPLTEVSWSFSLSIADGITHWIPAVKDRYLSVSLQTIPASYCNVARLWFYGRTGGPDATATSCLFVTLVLIFWGGWLVRLFQWDFHRLVFGVVYMHDIYIYMEDCAFTCSCLDCHPDILNEAFKKILKIQNGKRAFGPAWRKKKGISIQFTFRNDWRFQIAVTLNSPRGIEFFSRELSSRRWIFKEIPVPNCPKNS